MKTPMVVIVLFVLIFMVGALVLNDKKIIKLKNSSDTSHIIEF